jgi:hypothetical protein
MSNINQKDKIDQTYIESLFKNKIEEHQYLEFKRSESLDFNDNRNKKEISKDISAFANTYGGRIIYGIEEHNQIASDYSFIDGIVITQDRLEQIIYGNIQRKIEDLEITPVKINDDITKTVYVIDIPKSSNAPHMANDNKFYIRRNFKSEPMTEYEVRDVFNRVNKSNLEIVDIGFTVGSRSGNIQSPVKIVFKLWFKVRNIGYNITDNLKLIVKLPDILESASDTNIGLNQDLISKNKGYLTYSFYYDKHLFPEEETTIKIIGITVDYRTINIIREKPVELILYYNGGSKNKIVNLSKLLLFSDVPIDNIKFRYP